MNPAPPPVSPKSEVPKDLMRIFADVYGIPVEELSLESDLVEDIGWSNNPEELAFFLKRVNSYFDVHLNKELILEEDSQTVGDLVDLIESEQLG